VKKWKEVLQAEGGAPGTRAEILLQPMEKTMMRQAVPLQPMEVHCGADSHMQPMEDTMLEQLDVPCGKPTQDQAPGRTVAPWGTHAGALCS